MQNEELAKELHKPNIRKFENRKVHSSFINNTDLVQFSVKVVYFPAIFLKYIFFFQHRSIENASNSSTQVLAFCRP